MVRPHPLTDNYDTPETCAGSVHWRNRHAIKHPDRFTSGKAQHKQSKAARGFDRFTDQIPDDRQGCTPFPVKRAF